MSVSDALAVSLQDAANVAQARLLEVARLANQLIAAIQVDPSAPVSSLRLELKVRAAADRVEILGAVASAVRVDERIRAAG